MMIAINLRPGVKRGRAAPSFSLGLDRLKGLSSRLKDPWPVLAAVAWIGALGFLGYTFVRSSAQLGELEPRLEEARVEHRRFQDFLEQKRREEATRDSLIAQIRTIRTVDGTRYVWPHILNEVARALPTFTWLTDVSAVAPTAVPADTSGAPPPVEVQVTGRTVDVQGYTRFMRDLENSPWLSDVTAVSVNTVVEGGRAITAFVVRARFRPAGEPHLRVVPVAQSVEVSHGDGR